MTRQDSIDRHRAGRDSTIRTESRILVAAGIETLWAYLCDVARWAEWAPTVLECRIRGGGPLEPGAWVDQRARDLGWNHRRSERVTAVDEPHAMAFSGTMGTSAARWGMELVPVGGAGTAAMMWVEVDIANVMHAYPAHSLQARIQRVSDLEMAGIRAAVEADARAGTGSE
ncbi:SRPBCC family protein [uncultured Leifsonia sp.]|uniref:SRPBCC family protein n=1 Tax=uncultured Leifsonia sp. TaxID=340359 RepID=UPI0025D0BDC3|nr:SRPBCC family protein [uncultured Leifsonia sp.]